jgi:formate dehydrogenase iron-sulfur subunit
MHFGDRDAVVGMAEKRLAEVQGRYPDAMLANAGDVRTIYLLVDDPERYHKFAVVENTIGISRKLALKRLLSPISSFRQLIG